MRAGPRWFATEAELTGGPHGVTRESEGAESMVRSADGSGPLDRESTGARAKETGADRPAPPGRG
jgi:hypothetical protein